MIAEVIYSGYQMLTIEDAIKYRINRFACSDTNQVHLQQFSAFVFKIKCEFLGIK